MRAALICLAALPLFDTAPAQAATLGDTQLDTVSAGCTAAGGCCGGTALCNVSNNPWVGAIPNVVPFPQFASGAIMGKFPAIPLPPWLGGGFFSLSRP